MSDRWRLDWPTSSGGRPGRALLKQAPEDFLVEESCVGLDGSGEHLCLKLEKTGDNTEYVARQLASLAGCRHFDVGYCGLKDRHAVTRQWFSLYRPGQEEEDPALIEAVSRRWPVLASERHLRKLRRGEHSGNYFRIVLRQVGGERAAIEQALGEVRRRGCPNYFGPQRFGHQGGNLDEALVLEPAKLSQRGATGKGRRGHSRGKAKTGEGHKGALYFSAARSWLFNEVLARRVTEGSWLEPLEGEPGSNGETEARVTGPLWGDGGTTAVSIQGQLEREVVSASPGLETLFSSTRMKPDRRPLVLHPEDLGWQWLAADILQLEFRLAPGQYATTLLADVFELTDVSGAGNSMAEAEG